MQAFLKAKTTLTDSVKQIAQGIESLPPNLRTILVALCVSSLPGSQFNINEACEKARTYCIGINIDTVGYSQVENALQYFLQNGFLEVSEKSIMKKLGKGSRSNDFAKAYFELRVDLKQLLHSKNMDPIHKTEIERTLRDLELPAMDF